jgi:hypothetical protein
LRVQPTIQVSSEGTKAWRSISWNEMTRGAMPVPARNPEWPLLAEAARAAAIAERERLTASDGSGFNSFSPPSQISSSAAAEGTSANARRQAHFQASANLPISVFEAVSILI